jgi:hypothetical protein
LLHPQLYQIWPENNSTLLVFCDIFQGVRVSGWTLDIF